MLIFLRLLFHFFNSLADIYENNIRRRKPSIQFGNPKMWLRSIHWERNEPNHQNTLREGAVGGVGLVELMHVRTVNMRLYDNDQPASRSRLHRLYSGPHGAL